MVCAVVLLPSGALAKGEIDCATPIGYRGDGGQRVSETPRARHNPGLASVSDHEICFEGYISNFDGDGDNDGDGEPDLLRVPHFVVHRVDRTAAAPESRKRPSTWFTIDHLADDGIAPTDQSYVFSKRWRASHPNWFERGHLAQKYLLERISAEAAWFSHNLANAVPQRGQFNRAAWLDLECRVGAWATAYKSVWVITGPVFLRGSPTSWLREPKRPAHPVAIPDALFKIVVRRSSVDGFEALAFVMPQHHEDYARGKWDLTAWSTSIGRVEELTQQQFPFASKLTAGSRKQAAGKLWPITAASFDPGCRRFAKDYQ